MIIPFPSNGVSLRESRLLTKRESSFGQHMKEYGGDLKGTYFDGKKGLDRGLGAIGAAANVLFKAPDEIVKGALGQKYNAPHGVFGHTRADLGSLFGNVVGFRPLRAAADAWSLLTADVPLDTVNLLTGNNVDSGRRSTRSDIHRALAA